MNAAVPRSWPGETVVCLGCGPSLTPEDVDYVRGRARVIAINSAYRLAPWADVLYSSDRQWWAGYPGDFDGAAYSVGSGRGQHNSIPKHPSVVVLTNTGDEGLEASPDALRTGSNSGYAAINLAVHFGAARVLLLGYNMGAVNGQHHFADYGRHHSATPFALFRKRFKTMLAPLADASVEVVNCTHPSELNIFQMADLRAALGDTPSRAAAAIHAEA